MGKKFWKFIGVLLLLAVIAAAALVGYLSVTEYRPAERERLASEGTAYKTLRTGESVRLLSWNIGYGALGDNADFFMDGGESVYTADAARVRANLNGIAAEIRRQAPDLLLLQEVDKDADRSRHVDETAVLSQAMPGCTSSFANNFKVAFLPYPIPPIGKVDAGLYSISAYPVREAERIQLPVPFSWPVSLVNLKRCLLVQRIPIEGDSRELVIVNLHLEAYDDGEGKAEQTKALRSLLEKEAAKGNYVIAGGNFNQIFSTADRNAFPMVSDRWVPSVIDAGAFSGDWQFVMDAATPSCRSLAQPYRDAEPDEVQYYLIDGYILSGNIRLQYAETLDRGFVFSDHNPVLLEVVLEP